MTKKPMLATPLPDVLDLNYAYLVQPKYDGIRIKYDAGIPRTRTGKTIPNLTIAQIMRELYAGSPFHGLDIDGELLLWNSETKWFDPFNTIQSVVMAHKRGMHKNEAQSLVYVVFDVADQRSYRERLALLRERFGDGQDRWMNRFWLSPTIGIDKSTLKQYGQGKLLELCDQFISEGYEGAIIRRADALYKHGRATHELYKYVQWQRAEAVVIGMTELAINLDTSTSRAENKVPADMMGTLIVRSTEFGEFEIGTGFTVQQRKEMWTTDKPIGRTITFKYKPAHMKDKPCPAVFVGFRGKEDDDNNSD